MGRRGGDRQKPRVTPLNPLHPSQTEADAEADAETETETAAEGDRDEPCSSIIKGNLTVPRYGCLERILCVLILIPLARL